MNDFDDSPRRFNIIALLPVMMIILILIGNVMFGVTNILPQWRTHQELADQVAAAQKALDEKTRQMEEDNISFLNAQVERAQEKMQTASDFFISDAQADELLDALYQDARQTGVTIFDLQAPPPDPVEMEAYHLRTFHIQAEGPVLQLLNFVISIEEASTPGVVLSGLNLTQKEDRSILAMDITLHASAYAAGTALDNLPVVPTLAVQTPVPVVVEATVAVPETTLVAQPTSEVLAVTPDNACPGATPTQFKVGDQVAVHFGGTGRLNILSAARVTGTQITVVAKAANGDQLSLVAGPVCGQWNGTNLWYWLVDRQGVQGWAAEGISGSRWMCPLADPQCS
ncbi:MAG TPA: hypothetical protein VHO69_09735 [Phototrophicaceae bacterium]|nr:hypothetical protein [Phototrophicaceae bacterium]